MIRVLILVGCGLGVLSATALTAQDPAEARRRSEGFEKVVERARKLAAEGETERAASLVRAYSELAPSRELRAAAILEGRRYVSGRRRSERKRRAVGVIRTVASEYPKTPAGREAALMLRASSLAVGRPMIPLAPAKSAAGRPLDLGRWRGRVVLVDFWATWCAPCRQDVPELIGLHRRDHERGLEIISVSLDHDPKKWRTFVDKHGMPWHHHADGRGWRNALAERFLVDTIPHTIVVGRDGKVFAIGLRGEKLRAAIERALAMPASPR